ncbi:hypothetical protein QR680_018364 [Steinernema hermaphroditum]|uniref:Uncharacterized protein n=1 Tax=Steinernema hermaphroditum TaxID=289476 RepID=A0AA39HJY8_9BILA|nr:hypothetical protein QR680_018364 [Steinernema hermaphroditum]
MKKRRIIYSNTKRESFGKGNACLSFELTSAERPETFILIVKRCLYLMIAEEKEEIPPEIVSLQWNHCKSSSAASTRSKIDVAEEALSEEALKEDSTVEPEAKAPEDKQVLGAICVHDAQEQTNKEPDVHIINAVTVY